VDSDERLRLFCALLLPSSAIGVLVRWQEEIFPRRAEALRVVPAENLHVTLAFLGTVRGQKVPRIREALERAAEGAAEIVLGPAGYRETRSVGMIELSDERGRAEAVALGVWDGLERLGVYERERRRWLPHVTVVRFRERPRLTPALPALGRVVPSDAALMISRLRPSGAQYEVLESVSLGG
jgi:2'-5' RNA ligase